MAQNKSLVPAESLWNFSAAIHGPEERRVSVAAKTQQELLSSSHSLNAGSVFGGHCNGVQHVMHQVVRQILGLQEVHERLVLMLCVTKTYCNKICPNIFAASFRGTFDFFWVALVLGALLQEIHQHSFLDDRYVLCGENVGA